jgi:hypothetical protein
MTDDNPPMTNDKWRYLARKVSAIAANRPFAADSDGNSLEVFQEIVAFPAASEIIAISSGMHPPRRFLFGPQV